MAAQPVTPQRVREILSSFVNESDRLTAQTPSEKLVSRENGSGDNQPEPQLCSAGTDTTSTEVVSNRRTFASFLKRVETFSPITWFAKPPELSPLVCSRFGWENSEYDMLHCMSCNANLCGLLPSKADSKQYRKACEDLEKKLLSAHEKFCALAINPCPEAYLKLQLQDVEELRKSFLQRVSALRGSAHHLPHLVYKQLEIWGFAESHAAKFCSEEEMPESESQVVTLAVTGWTVRETNKQIIMCSMCRRQVGLWNFTPARGGPVANGSQKSAMENGNNNGDGDNDMGPPSKMRKIERQAELDPISSHHSWCPWLDLHWSTEDALTLLPISPAPSVDVSTSPSPPSTPAQPTAKTDPASKISTPAAPLTPASFSSSPQLPTTPCNNTHPSPSSSSTLPVGSPGWVMMTRGSGDGGGGEGRAKKVRQPAWVMVVRLVAPGLLSQSRCLVQRVRQSSIVEGLHCIRKMLKGWSSPENEKRKADLSSSSLSESLTTSPS